MSVTCVIGLQWGDEAKGKIIDLLSERFEFVIRYQGGANAGHSVVRGGRRFKLSLIPSGIFHPHVKCLIAAGVVLNPKRLLEEIDELQAAGVNVAGRLLVSDRAHVIFPWHVEEERLMERQAALGEAIGTTLRGIGPCYRDKAGRITAVRVGDMFRPRFREQITHIVQVKNALLAALAPKENICFKAEEIHCRYEDLAGRLAPYVADTTAVLLEAVENGKALLLEGAQGALLDIDHGTFPFVTSSNSSGAGITAGSGVPVRSITKVLGVVKAYCTRVGAGPFPTEQDNAIGEHIRRRGNEYGTVTRRPRRCGWLDAVAVRYAARLSGVDSIAVMLLDVLDELPELQICTAYEIDGRKTQDFPAHVDDLRRVRPIYETLPGWRQPTSNARCISDLPAAARRYLERVEQLLERPVEIVSVGPDREQTIFITYSGGEAKPYAHSTTPAELNK